MTEQQLEHFELERTNGRSVKFNGEEIAGAGGKWRNGKEQTRWSTLTLYRTKGGKYVLHQEYVTMWQGEDSTSQVTVCDNPISVIYALSRKSERERGETPTTVAITDEQFPLNEFPDEELGELESELLRRARAADPGFGKAAIEEVE